MDRKDDQVGSRNPQNFNASSQTPVDEDVEKQSIKAEPEAARDAIYRSISHMSGPDALPEPSDEAAPYREAGDEIYDKLSRRRKAIIVAVMSFCALLSPISSTSVLAATPEVAAEFNSTGSVINASNAGYMVLMAMSSIVWGPMSQVYGRRPVTLLNGVLFFLLSLATALAPNLASFFVFRALSAFEGTPFILLGAACIGDIYRPTERGTAMGWFMSGTIVGPAFGPFLGGLIVTYSSWRSIFWLQTALAGTGALGVFWLVPETSHHKKIKDLQDLSRWDKTKAIFSMINPIRVLRLFRHPALVMVAGGSAALTWNMYSLLTPIRYVLNPRFKLESPLLSGLFYLAPGCGYLAGTFVGGRWADVTVKRWIKKRGGVRVPEDRLWSGLPSLGILMPACMLVYGWTVDQEVGGIPVPVIAMFLQGVGQLMCFPSLNTYCLDVMAGQGAEVAAANFFVRYLAGCLGTAVVLPAVEGIGVGWFSTISTLMLVASAAGILAAIRWGEVWRKRIDAKDEARRRQQQPEGHASVEQSPDTSEEEQGQKQKEKDVKQRI